MTLDNISLKNFIQVYNGDLSSINEDKILSSKLIEEYISIVGGASVAADLTRRNERLNLNCYLNIMHCCENLINMGDLESVSAILKEIGYSAKGEAVKARVTALTASYRFKLDRLNASIKDEPEKYDNDFFAKEIAAVSVHYKMTIDKEKLSAKEYAYIVKAMSEEIRELNNKLKRK